MKKYTTRYTNDVIEDMSNRVNISGMSPQNNVRFEESAQRKVAEQGEWLLARRLNNNEESDSKESLLSLGFLVENSDDDLFYKVTPPEGWTKTTNGYWTTVLDNEGKERISQFFKGAYYDRRAQLHLTGK